MLDLQFNHLPLRELSHGCPPVLPECSSSELLPRVVLGAEAPHDHGCGGRW